MLFVDVSWNMLEGSICGGQRSTSGVLVLELLSRETKSNITTCTSLAHTGWNDAIRKAFPFWKAQTSSPQWERLQTSRSGRHCIKFSATLLRTAQSHESKEKSETQSQLSRVTVEPRQGHMTTMQHVALEGITIQERTKLRPRDAGDVGQLAEHPWEALQFNPRQKPLNDSKV